MKLSHITLCLLLAITAKSYAIEATTPASCRQQLHQLTEYGRPDKTKAPEPLMLLVWNVQKFADPSALAWLEERSAQIIMTQESIASVQRDFAENLNATDTFSPGYRTFDNETSGVGIVTTLETLMSCAWQHEEPWLLTPKATLVSALRTANQILLAVNLHAINFSLGTQELQEQLDAISNVIDQYTGPIVVAGDFNTWSKARTEILQRFIQRHELIATDFDPDYRVRPFSYPLDHILTKNLEVLTAQSEHSELSDHTPLMMTIRTSQAERPELAFRRPTEIERPLPKR